MGKGDKKSRRGKIIMGSTGVRRPKNKPNAFVIPEVAPVKAVKEVKKVVEKAKTEPKPKVKAAEVIAETTTEASAAPVKTVKKAVKKTKIEEETE